MSRSQVRVVLLCFFLSGVAGLIYEVAWTKALGLVFGHTVYAIATVLAAFMAGLAAGSVYLGKWGGRNERPVMLYGWIELLIAATGALSLLGLTAVRVLYVTTYHLVSGSMPFLETVRFAGAMLVLFIPTFLMGGTLPILAAAVTRSSSEMNARLGRLYWVNTTGAVFGALIAGFLLLPWFGLRITVGIAVACNVLAGCLALVFTRVPVQPMAEETPADAILPVDGNRAFLLASFALVGATSMAYEISWTRLLATTLGSSTYAFTTMLATFLTGIALGGALFEKWAARNKKITAATFGATQVLIGVGAVIFLVLFTRMPAIAWWMVTVTHKSFRGLLLTQFAICGLAMLPAAIVFGFNFPAITCLIAGRDRRASSYSAAVGQAIAANTLGAIVGSVATGFWLVPWLGSFHIVALAAIVNLLLAVFLLSLRTPRRTAELVGSLALAILAAIAGWSGFLYDPALANFSVANHPGANPSHVSADRLAHASDLLYSEDGLNATIAVARTENTLVLTSNGKSDASSGDSASQLMLGHLGMVFHKAPRRVLVIGFGSGMTVSAVARYPEVERIDCVEIEPAVLHAAPYLQDLNRGVLSDPRLHMITDDARNFLFTTQNRYDVIISEPSNPWIAGVATLFTDEFYSQIRSRLAPGGILVQWVQAYALFPQDARMILGTIAPHFSRVSLWRGTLGDFLILAQVDPDQLSFERMRQLWSVPRLRSDFVTLGLSQPEGLLAYHLLDDSGLRKLAAGATPNTDDRTSLEYRAPLAIFAESTAADNMRMFLQERSTLLPTSITLADNWESLFAAAQTSLFLADERGAGEYITELSKDSPTSETELLRGNWLAATKNWAGARAAFTNAQRLDPSSIPARMGLATAALQDKDYDSAERIVRDILDRDPGYLPALGTYALLESGRGDPKAALAWQTKRVIGDPSRPFEEVLFLADLLVRNGDNPDAEQLYIQLLNRDPYNGAAHAGLGELYRSEQRWQDAQVQFEVVVRYFPVATPDEYISLADVYRKMGRMQDAQYCLRQGERTFPDSFSLFHSQGGD